MVFVWKLFVFDSLYVYCLLRDIIFGNFYVKVLKKLKFNLFLQKIKN